MIASGQRSASRKPRRDSVDLLNNSIKYGERQLSLFSLRPNFPKSTGDVIEFDGFQAVAKESIDSDQDYRMNNVSFPGTVLCHDLV